MRHTTARRAAAVAVLAAAIVALAAAVAPAGAAARPAPALGEARARALVLAYVERRADPELHTRNPNGVPVEAVVVDAGDCARVARNRVRCAWGLLWANGHEVFNLREVVAVRPGVYAGRNVFPADAVDEDGRGVRAGIDPGGRGPLGPVEP